MSTKIKKRKSMGRGTCRVASDQDGHTHRGRGEREREKTGRDRSMLI